MQKRINMHIYMHKEYQREELIFMSTKRAELLMLFVTFCWGSSYLFMKEGLETFAPFTIVAYRFGIAFLVAALLLGRGWCRITARMVWSGLSVSILAICQSSGKNRKNPLGVES